MLLAWVAKMSLAAGIVKPVALPMQSGQPSMDWLPELCGVLRVT
jgi:hypothetical protein